METLYPFWRLSAVVLSLTHFMDLGDEFLVESESGNVFGNDVDLSEGDMADYDEENDASVSVSEFEAKFESL
eukprot:CAMPEP_0202448578 /NCGR_PEP_ID=MMETSP1360-20130828/7387_1 /ASSEMBLY_ACC=CAM_ASM_000848 /TAXON_ID=515479 /ORGANISM="Licmophora paradoxa, Strain CCMP2313" /LENGTH=71 /DNA_ID=CAMNT_0049066225 /DNA_START=811 /DNA_END=1027 /DNA_ORIENTATION=-